MARVVHAILVGLALAASPVLADDPGDARALSDAAGAIERIAGVDRLMAACPADIHRTRRNVLFTWFPALVIDTTERCEADIAACAQACIRRHDAEACLHLGVIMEVADVHLLPARKAFAVACAGGIASGCTNRGAGIRNTPLDGDDLSNRWDAAKQSCLFRTFDIACDGQDSWGCAMSAQTWHHGEGVDADPAQARALYQRACDLASEPGFAACVFARAGIDGLEAP